MPSSRRRAVRMPTPTPERVLPEQGRAPVRVPPPATLRSPKTSSSRRSSNRPPTESCRVRAPVRALRFLCPCEPASLPAAVCLVGCFGIVRLKCRSGGQTQSRSPLSPRSVSEREGSGNLRRFAPCGPHPPPAADCRTTILRSPSDELRPILASDAFRASSSGRRCRNWYSGGPAAECC